MLLVVAQTCLLSLEMVAADSPALLKPQPGLQAAGLRPLCALRAHGTVCAGIRATFQTCRTWLGAHRACARALFVWRCCLQHQSCV